MFRDEIDNREISVWGPLTGTSPGSLAEHVRVSTVSDMPRA